MTKQYKEILRLREMLRNVKIEHVIDEKYNGYEITIEFSNYTIYIKQHSLSHESNDGLLEVVRFYKDRLADWGWLTADETFALIQGEN
jgi:cellobiose phosphorylase